MLDVRDLAIRSVTVNDIECEYRILPNPYTFFGSRMTIHLPEDMREMGRDLSAAL